MRRVGALRAAGYPLFGDGLKRHCAWADTPSMLRSLFANRTRGGELHPRRNDRHDVETVRCELGELIDLSRSGMRLASTGPAPVTAGQVVTLHLDHHQGVIDVTAVVRWSRRTGLKRHEVGLEFTSVSEEKQNKLEQLARFGFVVPDRHRKRQSETTVHASAQLPDYYAVLEVSPGASSAEIRQAFHALAKTQHPDAGGDVEHFSELHRAWEVLKNQATRDSYDESRRRCA